MRFYQTKNRPKIRKSVPSAYKDLINECWNHDPSQSPSFDEIINRLKTNQEFITKNVDKQLFLSYVSFINQNQNSLKNVKFKKHSLESIKQEY